MAKNNDIVMHEKNLQTVSIQQKIFKIFVKAFTYAFLMAMALVVLFPFYWMIISSLKEMGEYRQTIPTLFPEKIDWANYKEVFENKDLVLEEFSRN